MTEQDIIEGAYYQHRYGGIYKTVGTARHTDDPDSKGVVYDHFWPFERGLWIRPLAEWCDGRFTQISDTEVLDLLESMDRDAFKEMVLTNKAKAKTNENQNQ